VLGLVQADPAIAADCDGGRDRALGEEGLSDRTTGGLGEVSPIGVGQDNDRRVVLAVDRLKPADHHVQLVGGARDVHAGHRRGRCGVRGKDDQRRFR
jgi:hypothetical protein